MISRAPMVLTSVEPLQGHEGTIVTLKGSGFATHIRNNCVVLGGMGACARVEPNPTPTELKVRIGPIAKESVGDVLAWPGTGVDLHTERISVGETGLRFSEASVFRNGAPVASAGVSFKLTKASPSTYAGHLESAPISRGELGSPEHGSVMRVTFPKSLSLQGEVAVDVCAVLKEPTIAIDFSAVVSARASDHEDFLRAIARGIIENASLVGEKVFADVARNHKTGEVELYVTKPYLVGGMIILRFASK